MKKIAFALLTVVAGFQFAVAHAADSNATQAVQAATLATHTKQIMHPLLDGEPQTSANWDFSSAHDADGYAVPRS
ncbi:hypothetical protein AB4Y38_41495 [Paraburkholderia sp. EG285A]|uniref:hypothetical protein n=1 Tax=Paraburkholderia sp. EG285A TaxID=3237009 RepID=UPI0034D3299D